MQHVRLLVLVCGAFAEDAVPLPPPPENMTQAAPGDQAVPAVPERSLSGSGRWSLLPSFAHALFGVTQTEGLSGFGTVSAGILAGAFYDDSQQGGESGSSGNTEGVAFALGVFGVVTDDSVDKSEVEQMIDEALRKAKEEWKEEVLRETRGIVQEALVTANLKDAQLEIQSFTKDLAAAPNLDFLEPDAALAYVMALENRVTVLAEKLFLPCMESGWGSQACIDRVGSGAAYTLDTLINLHSWVFAEIFRTLEKKWRLLQDHWSSFSSANLGLQDVARTTLQSNFQRVGCPNNHTSHGALESFKAAKVPYVLMRHDAWFVTYSEAFSDLASAEARYHDTSFNLHWSKAMMIVNSDFVNQRHYAHVSGYWDGISRDFKNHYDQKYKAGPEGPFLPFVAMTHQNWGVVTDKVFADLQAAITYFETQLNGGPKAAVVVDGRFTELRWYGAGNEGALRADYLKHFKAKYSPKDVHLLDKMHGYCRAMKLQSDVNVVKTQTDVEKAKECCGGGQVTCQLKTDNDDCAEETVLRSDIYRTMQRKFKGVTARYKKYLARSLDKFLNARLASILCDNNGCRDDQDISESTNYLPRDLGNFQAVSSLKRETWYKGMLSFEKSNILVSGRKVYSLDTPETAWSTETVSVDQKAGFARLIGIVPKDRNTPILNINGQNFDSPTCGQNQGEGRPQVCSPDTHWYSSAEADDPSPIFWDFNLTGSEVTITKRLQAYNYIGAFSNLVLQVQPTPHAWPQLLPPRLEQGTSEYTLNAYYGCQIRDNRYLRCTGEDQYHGAYGGGLRLEFKNDLKWDVRFYMRLEGLQGTPGGSAAALMFTQFFWGSYMAHGTYPPTLFLDGSLTTSTNGGGQGFSDWGNKVLMEESPVEDGKWHSYRIKRSEGALWVFIDDVLVVHYKLHDTRIIGLRIRPWRAVASIWGFQVEDELTGIHVLNNYHDQTGVYGKYFSFNMEDIDLNVDDVEMSSFQHLQVRRCRYNDDGSLQGSGDQMSVRLWATPGTKRGGNAHGRLADGTNGNFRKGDYLLPNNNQYSCPTERPSQG